MDVFRRRTEKKTKIQGNYKRETATKGATKKKERIPKRYFRIMNYKKKKHLEKTINTIIGAIEMCVIYVLFISYIFSYI